MTLTWPEALSRVTGQPVPADMRRIVETMARSQMREFFADRPQQIERRFDRTGWQQRPSVAASRPSEAAGRSAQRCPGTSVARASHFIRLQRRSAYPASGNGPRSGCPGWSEARDAVRNNEQLVAR